MGILARPLSADAGLGRALQDDLYSDYRPTTTAGVRITPDTAMGMSGVYACTTLITEDIAKVPLQMFEDQGKAGVSETDNNPLSDLLQHQPNDYQSAFEFREMLTGFSLLRKFGIAEIIPGPRGPVDQLIPLHPDLVREQVLPNGQRRYPYRDPKLNFQERVLLADEVFILRGKHGASVFDYARESMALMLATEQFAGFLFSRGAKFQGVVQAPKAFANDTVRGAIRKGLDEYAIGGRRAGRPLLLEDGMTWVNAGMTSSDAELMESRKWSLREVCRWFRVQPSKVADLENYKYATVEAENINYVTDTLLSWAIRWEQAIRRDLIIAKGRFFARHNLDSLLRGDAAARAQAWALAIMWGWMTRNEVRAKENMNPIDGLDEPLTPSNMQIGSDGKPMGPVALVGGRLSETLAPAARGQLRLLASDAASRVVRRETAALAKIAERAAGDRDSFRSGVDSFYAEHAEHVAAALHIPEHVARQYAHDQRAGLLGAGETPTEEWSIERVRRLAALAMDQEALAA